MSHLLANINLPSEGFPEPELYVRTTGTVFGDELRLDPGAVASFDTAFGLFAVGRWRRLTTIGDVVLRVMVRGAATVELVAVTAGSDSVVESCKVSDGTAELRLNGLQASAAGVLYARVTAGAAGAMVTGGRWSTTTAPEREVRLGVAITTFDRQKYVLATIERIVRLERTFEELRGKLRVVVVDNARNLRPDLGPDDPVRLIPNPNLGGAGGFARGLIELRDEGWASHVVLMDDDISMEPDALVRTVALLRHARSRDLCVHGAMLSEERRWMQFEAGSMYQFRSVYPLRAVGRFMDLRDRDAVIVDPPEPDLDYTAWWFTVFPIHLAQQNPLPVFVRGDDVAYGLMHTGEHTVTLNGIVVWHADFALKNNPSSLYYEVRNFALIDTLVFPKHRRRDIAFRFLSLGFRNLYSHRYASTEYMIRGMEQFLAGPEAWARIDHAALHDEIRRVDEEKAEPLTDELNDLPLSPVRPKIVRLVGFLIAAPLLGGALIPRFLRSRRIGVAPIDVRAVGLALRHDEILYRHPRLPEGFVCRRDRVRFKKLQRRVFAVGWRLIRTYGSLKRAYREAYPQLVSDEAWRERFGVS